MVEIIEKQSELRITTSSSFTPGTYVVESLNDLWKVVDIQQSGNIQAAN